MSTSSTPDTPRASGYDISNAFCTQSANSLGPGQVRSSREKLRLFSEDKCFKEYPARLVIREMLCVPIRPPAQKKSKNEFSIT